MNRYEELTVVLQYDSYGEKHLRAFDRMFIQAERAAILGERKYTIPVYVEHKVQNILIIIHQLKWESPFNI